jgi:hypothetical protein
VVDDTDGTITLNGPVKGIKVVKTKDSPPFSAVSRKEGESELDLGVLVKGDTELGARIYISLSYL